MAKGGDDDPAIWGAEALPINVVLRRLFPVPWATYCHAKAAVEADSDPQQKYVIYDADAYRLLVARQRETNELKAALRFLLKGQSSERWELWGRLKKFPIPDAQHIPASALDALAIDFEAGTADAQGMLLFDLRLRRKVLPADAAPLPTPIWVQNTVRRLLAKGEIREGMTKTAVARKLEDEREKDLRAGRVRRALKASYMEDKLEPWGAWPPSDSQVALPKQK